MTRNLAIVHTVSSLVPVFEELAGRHLPGWNRSHVVDESLLHNTIRTGELTTQTMRRVASQIWSAVDSGADAVLVTCSSIGPAVDATRPFCSVPLVRVDEGMAIRAVETGSRIGVLATLSTTMEPTRDLVARVAGEAGKPVEITGRVCEGAFEKLVGGDKEAHDRIVAAALGELCANVDVVVLAQASMAQVLQMPDAPRLDTPVLCSPELGVERLKSVLEG